MTSRRRFIGALVLATSAAAAMGRAGATKSDLSRPQIIGFSKPLIHFDPETMAELVTEIGWDGIDCPVRARNTHVVPERIEEDLPRIVEALERKRKSVPIVTTDIVRLDSRSEKILRTLSRLGIRHYRFGFVRYSRERSPVETLQEFSVALRDLSAANRDLGLRGGYQNHSGADFLGATLWELWMAMRDLDPETVGVCFDIGQAMVEGGLSWPSQVRILQSRWLAIQVKDFVWERFPEREWGMRWCPLGEGRVTSSVLAAIAAPTFAGPLIQHYEHLRPQMPREELLSSLKKDFVTLRGWLG